MTTEFRAPMRTIVVYRAAREVVRDRARTVVVRGQGVQGPPGRDGSGTGGTETQTATAAITLSGHRAVTPQADGTLVYADNATLDHRGRPLWITTAAYSSGEVATAVSHGLITEPSWSWSPGQVYLGADGVLTQTAPVSPAAFLAAVGEAVDATTLFVTRLPSITLI